MRDRYNLVPAHIRADIEREEMVDRMARAALPIIQAVHRYDHRLELRFIGERADPEWGVVPYRWHLVRHNNPPAPKSYMAITTEDGGYRDPDFGVLDELGKRDLWKHPLPLTDKKPSAFEERERTADDEARVDELASDLRAGARLPGDGGLTGKWWGRGRPKGLVGS